MVKWVFIVFNFCGWLAKICSFLKILGLILRGMPTFLDKGGFFRGGHYMFFSMGWVVLQGRLRKNTSASRAAIQPVPADVIAWR